MSLLKLLVLTLILGCSKTPQNPNKETKEFIKKPLLLELDSPIAFTFDETLVGSPNLAIFDGQTVQKKGFIVNDQAMLDLIEKNYEQVLYLSYSWASSMTTEQNIVIHVPFREPKKTLELILKSYGIPESSKIEVQFLSENTSDGTVKIGDITYTQKQLSEASLPFAKNLQRLFKLKINKIEEQVTRKVLIKKANDAQIPLSEYIEQNIYSSNLKITDDEVRQYATKNNISPESIDDSLLVRLRSIALARMKTQKLTEHAAELLKGVPVRVAINPPQLRVKPLIFPEGTPQRGSGSVKVTLMSNFLCNHCQNIEQFLNSQWEKYPNHIKLSYLFHFKPENRRNQMVAEASLCIEKIDSEKFWTFQNASHSKDFDGNEKSINQIVESLGINLENFKKCFLARDSKSILNQQKEILKPFGYLQIPVVVINGQVFENISSTEKLSKVLHHEISKIDIQQVAEPKKDNPQGIWQWLKSFFKKR